MVENYLTRPVCVIFIRVYRCRYQQCCALQDPTRPVWRCTTPARELTSRSSEYILVWRPFRTTCLAASPLRPTTSQYVTAHCRATRLMQLRRHGMLVLCRVCHVRRSCCQRNDVADNCIASTTYVYAILPKLRSSRRSLKFCRKSHVLKLFDRVICVLLTR